MIKVKHTAAAVKTKASSIRLNVKAVGDNGEIEGYASVWDVVDSYNEAVLRGAFTNSLAKSSNGGRSIKMLYQHDRTQVIGVWDEIKEDDTGLYVKGRILKDATSLAAEVWALIKAGAIDEMSIGYREIDTKKDPNRQNVLLLKELDLREISIVTFGALGQAARVTGIKSILDNGQVPTVPEFESFLREQGFSDSLATAIAGKAAPHLRPDPEAKADEDLMAFLSALRA